MQKLLEISMVDAMNVIIAEGQFIDGLNLVGGENASGKSSFLTFIQACFGGKKILGDEPLRRGAYKFKVRLKLTDYDIELSGNNDKSSLKVTRSDGGEIKGTALQFLKELINDNPMFFDLSRLLKLDNREVVGFVKKLFNINTELFDNDIRKIELQRYDDKKEKTRLEGVVSSITEVKNVGELKEGGNILNEITQLRQDKQQIAKVKADGLALRAKNDKLIEQVDQMKKQIIEIEQQVKQNETTLAELRSEYNRNPKEEVVDQQITDKETELANIDTHNQLVRRQQDRQIALEELKSIDNKLEEYEEQLSVIKFNRSEFIKSTGLAIDGLEFVNNELLYNGFSLNNLSTAERNKLFIKIAARQFKPDSARFLCLDGSFFDRKSIEELKQIVQDEDVQLVVEHPFVEQGITKFFFKEGKTITNGIEGRDD
jgi:hypothetical protein